MKATDTLPVTTTVGGKAVKEAIAYQIPKELCSSLRQQVCRTAQ